MSLYARIAEEKLRSILGKRFGILAQETSKKLNMYFDNYTEHPNPECRIQNCAVNLDLLEIEVLPSDSPGTLKLSLGMEIYTSNKCSEDCEFDHICYPVFVIYLSDDGRIKDVKLLNPGC